MSNDRANGSYWPILQITAVVLLLALLAGILLSERRRNAAGLALVEAEVLTVELREQAVGYVFRTETVLQTAQNGAVRYAVERGEAVQAGDRVLFAYAGEHDGADRAVGRMLSAELSFWRTLAAASDAWQTAYFTAYENFMRACVAEDATDRLQEAEVLLGALTRREVDGQAILLRIEALEREFAALVEDNGAPEELFAPETGVFFEGTDGYEAVLQPALLPTLTPAALEGLLAAPAADPTAVGRIVTGETLLAVPIEADLAAAFTVGEAYALLLNGESTPRALTLAGASLPDAAGRVLLSFRLPQELSCDRRVEVALPGESYTGIRVPMAAVRSEGEEIFVYVAAEGRAERRRLVPLLYRDGYCLCEAAVGDGLLAAGEEIVLTSRRIYEGKRLK